MLNALKVAAMFIGALVGAGFATGRELMVYFGRSGWITPLFAGIVTGFACALFLTWGKYSDRIRPLYYADKSSVIAVFPSMSITYAVMTAAAEELTYACTGIPLAGLISGMIFSFLSATDIKFVKNISSMLVILLIASSVMLVTKCEPSDAGTLSPVSAVAYCGMNMLTGGYLVKDEGKNMSSKAIFAASFTAGVAFSVLLAITYTVASQYPDAAMPVYELAAVKGMKAAGGILILAAVLSTMLGAGRVVFVYLQGTFGKRYYAIIYLLGLASSGFTLNFERAVEIFYPMMGYMGTVMCCVVCCIFAATALSRLRICFRRRT